MHYEANTAEPDQTACGECPNQDLPYLPIPDQFGLAGVELPGTYIYISFKEWHLSKRLQTL